MGMQLRDRESIKEIIQDMTLDNKIALLSGGGIFSSAEIEKYGIPSACIMDGGTGFNTMQKGMALAQAAGRAVYGMPQGGQWTPELLEKDKASIRMNFFSGTPDGFAAEEQQIWEKYQQLKDTEMPDYDEVGCYPPGMLLGATWNKSVVYNCAHALGKEMEGYGIDVLLGSPNVNLHRDPLCGRLFEGYSEDPYLVSILAPEFVRGVQDAGIVANVKHFAANNQETWRMGVNEKIAERALRELYLPGFRACVQEGQCKTVMSAYNKINGTACSQNTFLLKKVLRDEWGFEGLVMSDWNGVYDWPASINAGNDLAMPGPLDADILKKAVLSGEVSMETVDTAVERFLACLLEMPVMKGRSKNKIDPEDGMRAAYVSAAEGITLLKNKNHTLPLDKSQGISFWGESSKGLICSGEGSAEVVTHRNTDPLTCVTEKIGKDKVLFQKITDETKAIVAVVSATGQEGQDRKDMQLSGYAKDTLEQAIACGRRYKIPVIAVLNVVGPVEIMKYEGQLDAIICTFIPGMGGGQALADILFGDVNPSGKLPITFPKYYKDCPTYGNFPGEYGEVVYGEGLYVGYRYYDKKDIAPLYPFGHGLSYTTFELTKINVEPQVNLEEEDGMDVEIWIKNSGGCAGKEVIQIYVEDVKCSLDRPVKELKGFEKIFLEPGQEEKVKIHLPKAAFAFYDTKLGKWIVEPGKFVLHIGTSSKAIVCKREIQVFCKIPYEININSSIAQFAAREDVLEMLADVMPEMNVEQDLKAVMIFQPDESFETYWKHTLVRLLANCSEEEKKQRFIKVCKRLEAINAMVK